MTRRAGTQVLPDASTVPPGVVIDGEAVIWAWGRLYSRIGFAHEYRPLNPEELTAVLTQRLPAKSETTEDKLAHATAAAAIVRITGGNFRLVDRLLIQVQRIQKLNRLTALMPEIVDAARESLLIGH